MKLYRIHTINRGILFIKEILNAAFDGYTIIDAESYWKGEKENGVVIEVASEDGELVRAVADKIKKLNGQEAVLVTESIVSSVLV